MKIRTGNCGHKNMETPGSLLRQMLHNRSWCPGDIFDDMPQKGDGRCLSYDHDWNLIDQRCEECLHNSLRAEDEPEWKDLIEKAAREVRE